MRKKLQIAPRNWAWGVFLAAVSLFMAACDRAADGLPSGKGGVSGDKESSVAMGRYLEEQLAFPEPADILTIGQDEGGRLHALGKTHQGTAVLWRSGDNGDTWERLDMTWLEALTGEAELDAVSASSFLKDGSLLLLYKEEIQKDRESVSRLARIDEEGQVTSMPVVPTSADTGEGVNSLLLTDGGDLLCSHYFEVTQLDNQTGGIKHIFDPKTAVSAGTYLVLDNLLAVDAGKAIQLYNLNTGTLEEEILCMGNAQNMTMANRAYRILAAEKENTLYYCDPSGLYRTVIGGTAQERLMDGTLSSLNKPSVYLQNLFVTKNQDFLVHCFEEKEGSFFLRYRYHSDIPALPSTELRVYSLKDSKTLRQAMSLYQRDNPEVRLVYETGLPSDFSGETAEQSTSISDALRILSTELLAGKGPDILMLDGLPIQRYIAQGALADLTDVTKPLLVTEELLPQVAESFRQEGKLHGIPARFSVPMVMGSQEALNSIHSLEALADWLEKQPAPQLENTLPKTLVEMYYPLAASTLFGEEGKADEKALAEFLATIRRLSQIPGLLNKGYDGMGESVHTSTDLQDGAILWSGGKISLNVANLDGMSGIDILSAALNKRDGDLRPLNGGTGPILLPRMVLGVNAAGKQQEAAKKFLGFVLSKEALAVDFEEGLPVNRTAFLQNTRNPYPEETKGYCSISGKDASGQSYAVELYTKWPGESFLASLIGRLENIQTAAPVEQPILQILLEGTEAFLNSDDSPEKTAAALAKRLSLYQEEG